MQPVQVTEVAGVKIGAGGYLVVPFGRGVPDALWDRLKHEITKAGMLDDFATAKRLSYRTDADAVEKADAEERLFQRWTERTVGEQAIWPWSRGWTPELARSYLFAQIAEAA
jgi:hypothetical protein